MRSDFHKVLIERPRSGWRCKRQPLPRLRVTDWDGEDFADRPLPRPRRTKHFDDLLGPLRKWLHKQVNRPWDKVYSELVAGIDRRSTVGQHLIDHVMWEVAVNVHWDDQGRLIEREYGWREFRRGLFVHPRTGILRYQAPEARRELQARERTAAVRRAVTDLNQTRRLGPERILQRCDGLWYELRVRPLDPEDRWRLRVRDGKLPARLLAMLAQRRIVDGDEVLGRRQLSKAELRRHGLQNMAVEDHEQARSH